MLRLLIKQSILTDINSESLIETQTHLVIWGERTVQDSTRKRKYETPTLEKHGAVSKLTLGVGGSITDHGQQSDSKRGGG